MMRLGLPMSWQIQKQTERKKKQKLPNMNSPNQLISHSGIDRAILIIGPLPCPAACIFKSPAIGVSYA